jgi:tellurite resistance protein TerC
VDLSSVAPYAALAVALVIFLSIDLRFFARGREPSFREGVWWSLGWLVVSLAAALIVWWFDDGEAAVLYTTVYLIERSLSLDNLFVFILLFAYFAVPSELRARLIEEFHFVIYLLGILLIALAVRVWRGVEENVDPDRNLMVRLVRRVFPVSNSYHGHHWFIHEGGIRYATPLLLCLAAIVFADIAFAIDSIPAAFAITQDPLLIWMGNVFALLGLRALFVLVEGLMRRFRYLDETIAVVLGLVGVKLLIEDVVEVSPEASLGVVALAFTIGIVLSVWADRRLGEVEDESEHGVQAD